jgi:hypothetical protein
MRYQTVLHEELQTTCREPRDDGICGEMISNTTHLVHLKVGQRREWPDASADGLLRLAAAPTFAIMALLTGVLGGGAPDELCSTVHASPLSGMVPMYLLMSAFHFAPWLNLISSRQNGSTEQPRVRRMTH